MNWGYNSWEWRKWFAWRPVRLNYKGKWVWLEFVYRKPYWVGWDYRKELP